MKERLRASWALGMVLVLCMITVFGSPESTYAATVDIKADSAILVDADSGKILYEKDSDLTLPPASMAKMMTEYLVLEAINSGEISWEDTTQISNYPYSISANSTFSGVGLTQNQDYTVRELYEAMAINSDNGTSIALAELVAGSEGEFVKRMNEKAEELGMPDYQFVNATGLENKDLSGNHPEGTDPDGTNLLSARSAAILAYHLVNDFPEALEISSMTSFTFGGKEINNYNWMLPGMPGYLADFGYEGLDGLKTGFTDLAGFCFTGTAERNGQRLISVVMKTNSEEARFEETKKLLDYGFEQFEQKELFPAGHQVDQNSTVKVSKGKESSVELETAAPITAPVKKGEEKQYEVKVNLSKEALDKSGNLEAPFEKGEKVGTAELVYNGEQSYDDLQTGEPLRTEVDVVTTSGVEKANWFMLTIGAVGDFFGDIFNNAVNMVNGWF
ncbi:serine hydrolase [Halobacillus massiliensis]|uniref:serine hydrolase n=1 Tax=Halobacillus massiliensis TaxID=1926286 RepID=UPI001FEBE45C|nr:serine hydrolase [Halobacillus massiliensis]